MATANSDSDGGQQGRSLEEEYGLTSGDQTFFFFDGEKIVVETRELLMFAFSDIYAGGAVSYDEFHAEASIQQGRARYPVTAAVDAPELFPRAELGRMLVVEGYIDPPSRDGAHDNFAGESSSRRDLIEIEGTVFFRAFLDLYFHSCRHGWEVRHLVIYTGNIGADAPTVFNRFYVTPSIRADEMYRRIITRAVPPEIDVDPEKIVTNRPILRQE